MDFSSPRNTVLYQYTNRRKHLSYYELELELYFSLITEPVKADKGNALIIIPRDEYGGKIQANAVPLRFQLMEYNKKV